MCFFVSGLFLQRYIVRLMHFYSITPNCFIKLYKLWAGRCYVQYFCCKFLYLQDKARSAHDLPYTFPSPWWCHHMKTLSDLPAFLRGIHRLTSVFPHKGSVTRTFVISFDRRLCELLDKQSNDLTWHMTAVILRHLNVYEIAHAAKECRRVNVTQIQGQICCQLKQ